MLGHYFVHTPRHIFSKSVTLGIYSHIGIKNAVKKILNFLNNKLEQINLLINMVCLLVKAQAAKYILFYVY